MPEKLFVGGLPFDFSDEQLKELFAKAGAVLSAVMVPDPKNKRTRGFGFVTLSGKEEALTAIQMLNGTKVGEKNIYITEAREKPPRRDAPSSRRAPPLFRPSRFSPSSPDARRSPFSRPAREGRPRRTAPPGAPRFPPAPRDREERKPSFRGNPRERGPRQDRPGKPAKKPFYQKFAKPK